MITKGGEVYDYIIVGAGIAGLYAHERLNVGTNKILVLEASNKVGGRMGQDMFYNTPVSIGAGIGRKSKDKLLQKLLKKHNIKTSEFPVHKRWLTVLQEDESREIIAKLKHEYHPGKDAGSTFKDYATRILGQSLYNKFMKHYEYTDMQHADAYETLFHYGLEDNNNGWTGISIPWNKLLDKMTPPRSDIVYNHRVEKLQRFAGGYWLIDGTYMCKNVIIATTVSTLKKLLPMHRNIYKQIESQPFMRIYGKFGKESAEILKEATQQTSVIVNNQVKRIIPINPDSGVYMVVYSDNSNAEYMKDHVQGNDHESREWLCRKLEQALSLPLDTLKMTAIKKYYWHEGTHYYIPFGGNESYETWITKAKNPEPGIYVVGEMISRDQGWVEGALQSVDNVF
jgi:hypothetical protein